MFTAIRRTRTRSEKESPRKIPPNTRSPKKIKSLVSSDSEDNGKRNADDSNRSLRCRTLRARKTWNYAKMLGSNSENSDDSDKQDLRPRRQRRKTNVLPLTLENSDDSDNKQELRPRRQRRKPEVVAITPDSFSGRCLRRNLQERHYVENTDSSEEEDDDDGVNISVSVSSRGRIRRLTAKARASVFRD